jgi:hypothetical protein
LNANLNFAATTRSTFRFSVTGGRVEEIHQSGASNSSGNAATYHVPEVTSGSASLGWSYEISPRTQFGIDLTTTRAFAALQKGYVSSGSVSLSRTLSRKWFTKLSVGVGYLNYTSRTIPIPHNVQYLGSGSLGYKTGSHNFIGTYSRTAGDGYGLGSASTSSATAAWNWRRPASTWSVFMNLGYQKLQNATFHTPESWQAGGGLGKALSSHISMSLQYGYLTFPAAINVPGNDLTESGVVLSINWSPSLYR